MTEEIKLLNHGYIRHVETWGSDERIVEAARMSTGKGFLGWGGYDKCKNCPAERATGSPAHVMEAGQCFPTEHVWEPVKGDEKLLRYLWENHHDTPFEMGGMVVEVQAPIVVFREWHRHRVPWSYNEASARYAPLPALDYLPTVDRVMRGGGHLSKQTRKADGAVELTEGAARDFLERLERWQRDGEQIYQLGLAWGVPKELARGAMSVFRFSKMRAHANVRGWTHFLNLRADSRAQEEIRLYAEAAATLLRERFPRTMALYDERAGR